MDIKKKLKFIPDLPGVYLMKDKSGKIIYIGKSSALRKRVSSYFAQSPRSSKITLLVPQIKDIDYLVCSSEAEALLVEAALIKEHRPKYNIELKDDKAYPMLKLKVGDKFATLTIVRRRFNDGARYFGPFTDSGLLKDALSMIRKIFKLRTCRLIPKKECLDYHLGYCSAPCIKKISKSTYRESIKELELFLDGKKDDLVKNLTERMECSSKALDFEKAASIRDKIRALTSVSTTRVISTFNQIEDLKITLGLKKEPRFIEAFDVSNIMGKLAVGSMVVFRNGFPYPDGYRKFRIKTFDGIDDYKMMREVVHRHFEDTIKEKKPFPDLVVIDGGKGHLNCAKNELDKLILKDIPVIGLAKEFEKIYLIGNERGITLKPGTPALKLLQFVRDEAHRFAVGYHKVLRRKTLDISELDLIEGIGKKRKRDLIKYFGNIENIKKAKIKELRRAGGISEKAAETIKKYFEKNR